MGFFPGSPFHLLKNVKKINGFISGYPTHLFKNVKNINFSYFLLLLANQQDGYEQQSTEQENTEDQNTSSTSGKLI